MNKSNCNCNANAIGKGKCNNCSKIKMFIGLKNGHKHSSSKYWYSFYKKNKWKNDDIITGMVERFKKTPYYNGIANVLQFYDNQTNQLLKTVKL